MKILDKNIKKNFIIIFPLIIFILGIITHIYVDKKTSYIEHYILTEKDVDIYHNGKKDFTGIITDYVLHDFKNDDSYTMHMKIPKNTIKNPVLFYDNVNTGVNIYVDDKLVYTLGMDTPSGGTISHANIKVPLHNLEGKKEIIMEIRALSNTTFRGMPICTLLNAKDADYYFLTASTAHQLLALISFILFLFGIFIVIFCGLKETILKKILILSLMCLSIFIQVISAYKLIQLISDDLVIDVYLEYYTRFSTVALIVLYLYLDDSKKKRIRHLIISVALFAHGTIATILQILKIKYLNDTLNLYIFLTILAFADLCITLFNNLRKKKDKKIIYTLLIIIIIFAGIAITTIYFLPKYLVLIFDLLPFFMLMVVIIFYIDMIYKLYEVFHTRAEKSALSRLAYIDPLTGLANRRKLDSYISELTTYNKKFTLYSFDLNALKHINDTYGHHNGDTAIKTFATCLGTIFQEGFCCRTGGDEFLVIMENSYDGTLLKNLDCSLINAKNTCELPYNLGYSVGYTSFMSKESLDFKRILSEADLKMYENKKAKKMSI